MNRFVRWWRFNLVGAMGVVVQLGVIALMNKWLKGHYLAASAVAVEMAVLHNFVWHRRFTWRDRREGSPLVVQLMRFHLSNGLVSLVGNVALMRVLVHEAHLPVLASNGIAIACCSVVNFYLGENWAFAAGAQGECAVLE